MYANLIVRLYLQQLLSNKITKKPYEKTPYFAGWCRKNLSIRICNTKFSRQKWVTIVVHYRIDISKCTWIRYIFLLNMFKSFKNNGSLTDMDARPWDFQAEECALRACVDRFNNRRYSMTSLNPDFDPVDNCIQSVLGQCIELSEDFKENYERWLEMEVFSNQIDWDQVLCRWDLA